MRIEQQVNTLQQGQRLKELGVSAPSYFTWTEALEYDSDGSKVIAKHPVLMRPHLGEYDTWPETMVPESCMNHDNEFETGRDYPAYTCAELGAMLPDGKDIKRGEIAQIQVYRSIQPAKYITYATYASPSNENEEYYPIWKEIENDTMAQSMASILIHLLENNLLTADSVNSKMKEI